METATFGIFEKLGGLEGAFAKLRAAGRSPKTADALRMWRARGQIPGDWAVALMEVCEGEGIPYSSADFRLAGMGRAA